MPHCGEDEVTYALAMQNIGWNIDNQIKADNHTKCHIEISFEWNNFGLGGDCYILNVWIEFSISTIHIGMN